MILPEENRTKYILGVVILFLILVIIVVAFQQKTMMNLKKEISEKNTASLNSGKSTAINSPSTVQAVQESVKGSMKEIKGVIKSRTGDELSVEAEIVDFSKLSGLTEDELSQNAASFPKTKKNYTVTLDDKTQFGSLKPEALTAGKTVMVESNDPIYTSNRINASKISIVADPNEAPPPGTSIEDQIRQTKFVGGIIKEIGDKYFIVGTTQIDLAQVKDSKDIEAKTAPAVAKYYKVFFDEKTQFVDKGPSELAVDQFVRAFSSSPVYSVKEFTATKILGPCTETY